MEERIALAESFDEVGKVLGANKGMHLAQYSAREVRTLAGMSRGLGDLGGADLDRVRQNWMRVRANTFDDAAWFRFSESDPAAQWTENCVLVWNGPVNRAMAWPVGAAVSTQSEISSPHAAIVPA